MQTRFDKTYKIISNKEVCAQYFELKVKASKDLVKNCNPGQFFMLTVPGVFLRRPLSVHDAKGNEISFLYKIAGKGTKILSKIKSGEIAMLGPLGNGYPLTSELYSGCHPAQSRRVYKFIDSATSRRMTSDSIPYSVIVAGGTGIASVYFLATKLKNKGTLYYGARSKKDLLCLDKFKKCGWKIIVSTEDGSKGYKGFITEKLKRECGKWKVGSGIKDKSKPLPRIHASTHPRIHMYVCGPTPMMKEVFKIAKEKNINGFASLEEKMACGIGNCQGCAVKINGQNKMVCKDGPVFRIGDIEFGVSNNLVFYPSPCAKSQGYK